MTPTVGTYDAATYTWEETKYIVYKVVEPAAGIDSPYNDNAATQPFFEFADMQYYETFGDTSSVNIRHSCPITYTVEAGTGATFSTPSLVSGNLGYDGVYRVTLDTASYQAIGTYSITVVGEAEGNSNQFKINFILNLKDFCHEMAVTNSKVLNTPILTNMKYTHYDGTSINIPELATDEMTPVIGTYDAATYTWEETKYIYYNLNEPDPSIDSPYIDNTAIKPYFEFTDMQYYEDPTDITSVNIRHFCKITYDLEPAGQTLFTKGPPVSGTEGYDGVYRLTLNTNFEDPSPPAYSVTLVGEAHNNPNKFRINFILNLHDFCAEMAKQEVIRVPLITNIKYSQYDDSPLAIPTDPTDTMTPVKGTYTASTASTNDIWEETKYIIYKQADPSTTSPYLDPAAVEPFFEFTDNSYTTVDPTDTTKKVNVRHTCPFTYVLEAGTHS